MPKLVETNIYRVLKPCSNCPFTDDGKDISLQKDRVDMIKDELLENVDNSFTCHKTAYGLDVDMNSSQIKQQPKMCAGAYQFLKKMNKPNTMMLLAERLGRENHE